MSVPMSPSVQHSVYQAVGFSRDHVMMQCGVFKNKNKGMWALKSNRPETESLLCRLLALWCQANYLATLSPSFLICKWE